MQVVCAFAQVGFAPRGLHTAHQASFDASTARRRTWRGASVGLAGATGECLCGGVVGRSHHGIDVGLQAGLLYEIPATRALGPSFKKNIF